MSSNLFSISEVLSLLQKIFKKMIAHNGDNYTNKLYNMSKENIKKKKVK